jgi:hypothetical protein
VLHITLLILDPGAAATASFIPGVGTTVSGAPGAGAVTSGAPGVGTAASGGKLKRDFIWFLKKPNDKSWLSTNLPKIWTDFRPIFSSKFWNTNLNRFWPVFTDFCNFWWNRWRPILYPIPIFESLP